MGWEKKVGLRVPKRRGNVPNRGRVVLNRVNGSGVVCVKGVSNRLTVVGKMDAIWTREAKILLDVGVMFR